MLKELSSGEVNIDTETRKNVEASGNIDRENKLKRMENGLDAETDDTVRNEIEEKSPYSSEVNKHISSVEELEIYQKAGLYEETYDEPPKIALVRDNIDMHESVDHMGRDNSERIENGLSPMTKDGDIIELHHIGQSEDSPLAELTEEEHRGTGNDAVLHDKSKESEIDRGRFSQERKEYWQEKAYFYEACENGDT